MLHTSSIFLALLPVFSLIPAVHGQGGGRTCNATSACPASSPCCSEFGFCGDGPNFCLGGCNSLWSHAPKSCKPAALCKSSKHTFPDNSRILSNATFYNGNASEYDWVVDKGNILNTNQSGGELALTLTQTNGGTRISSTRYLHYGTVTARLKTGRWPGVVTAFITMSDVKDEIDWEFPGKQVEQAQTNLYWLGVPNYNNGKTIDGLTDTFADYHEYTIDWQQDTLRFLIDNKEVRSVSKADLQNAYPSTPARVQLSLWPAGINSSAPGTVQWAGGMIDWNDPDYVSAGHFYTVIQSVSINCSDPGSVPPDAQSYVYGPNVSTNGMQIPQVTVTNQTTIVNSAPGLRADMCVSVLAGIVLASLALLWA